MNITRKRKILGFIAATLLILGLTASSCDDSQGAKNTKAAAKNDRDATAESLRRQQESQPTPIIPWSQFRQTVIEVTLAKANGIQTTSFFFLEGVGVIGGCPSIGFPVPGTAQLTAPETKLPDESLMAPQAEPTGVHTGSSTGTYTLCVSDDGETYVDYWEGYVRTVGGPAKYTEGKGVELIGQPTGDFTQGE